MSAVKSTKEIKENQKKFFKLFLLPDQWIVLKQSDEFSEYGMQFCCDLRLMMRVGLTSKHTHTHTDAGRVVKSETYLH